MLSHAGGTLPYIAGRAADLADQMALLGEEQGEFVHMAKAFYMDLALAGYEGQLQLVLGFAAPDHVLYGSDFPFAGQSVVSRQKSLIGRVAGDELDRAARNLFPRFFDWISILDWTVKNVTQYRQGLFTPVNITRNCRSYRWI